ncbi:MAG: GTP-binding protein [Acetobacteraceae bacterium]|nr:GTP-binding protein [Acetobacteraceae bacterium]
MPSGRRSVTILSGFLGSGKTTLLRRYLAERAGDDVAIIINEYGTVGVDHHLVRMVGEQSVLLLGGCVCCTRREDLARTLRDLLDMEQSGRIIPLRQVVIETSGLADPVPVLFTLATDPVLKHHFAAAAVVITLDALNAAAQIEHQPEVRKQIVAADVVVITKPDLVGREQVAQLRIRARQLNPTACIVVSSLGDGFDVLTPRSARELPTVQRKEADGRYERHPEVQAASLGFTAPLDWPAFSIWLGMLLHARGPDVLRIKGLLDIGDAGPVVLNVAQHVVHPPEHLGAWPQAERRSYLTFITRRIDPARIALSLETFQYAGGRTDLRVTRLA